MVWIGLPAPSCSRCLCPDGRTIRHDLETSQPNSGTEDLIPVSNDLELVTALDIDGNGDRHPLGLVERATENTAVVQALIDNLIERGLDPTVCRLFIIDGAKALSKVIRRTFGGHTPRSTGASFIRPAT
jgi:hypothetical protein